MASDLSADIEVWPEPRLRAWQVERTREVVRHADGRSPFYRRLWLRHGVRPGDGSQVELEALPIVRKRDLLAAGEDWLRSGEGPVGFSTRGTSGEPLLLWLSPEESEAYVVPTVRGFRWAGLRAGMTALLLSPAWHRLAAMEGHAVVRLGGRPTYFWGSLGGSLHVDAFLEAVEETRPSFITSTPPFLLTALRRCEETGRDARAVFEATEAVVLAGLPLTPGLRRFLQRRMGRPRVFERGGTQEGAALDECEAQLDPHVHADVCYLEVVGDDGRAVPLGSRGRLVVTKLVAGGSPFVRYDTEDIAAFVPGACPCGRTLPRLRIFGRPESSVVVGERVITAYDVRHCVDEDPELAGRVVLLVRDADRREVLRVVVEGRPADPSGLRDRLRERLGVEETDISWLGDAQVSWGFRQVLEASELRGR